uniref:Uncharacterized protein n=1 Tax=Arundo donax TaxID=35708 RepID=A0A0A9BVH5_ARUDO
MRHGCWSCSRLLHSYWRTWMLPLRRCGMGCRS